MSALFPDIDAAVASFRRDRLALLGRVVPVDSLTDGYIEAKLQAAEADAEARLRVFFSPVEVIPDGADEDTGALDEAGTRWIKEPGYDFEPMELFAGERWGLIETRQLPIISVTRITFSWPAPGSVIYTVPTSWFRIDKKYGQINLVPTANYLTLPMSTWIMTTLSAGRRVALMIQVRYRAGLENWARDYPQLSVLVQRLAALSILQDAFIPQSGSISADGLSQSSSYDVSKFAQDVDQEFDRLRQKMHGIRTLVI